jgi:hypothetical protein
MSQPRPVEVNGELMWRKSCRSPDKAGSFRSRVWACTWRHKKTHLWNLSGVQQCTAHRGAERKQRRALCRFDRPQPRAVRSLAAPSMLPSTSPRRQRLVTMSLTANRAIAGRALLRVSGLRPPRRRADVGQHHHETQRARLRAVQRVARRKLTSRAAAESSADWPVGRY